MADISAFSKKIRPSHQLTVHDATQLHLTPYLLGDVKRLYSQIKSDTVPQLEEFGFYTEKDGRFNPRENCLIGKRYKVTRIINGNGLSGVVVLAEDLFCAGRPVVLKVLHSKFYRLGIQEAHTLQMLVRADPFNYAHLVRLLNTVTFDSHYCLVFEPLIPVHLNSLFHKIPKHKALQRIRQVGLRLLSSVAFIHGQNLIHADLKPENILLKNKWDFESVHVADFGSALKNIESEVSLYCEDFEIQTPVYRAPEVIFGMRFGQEIDMWSLGCVLAELYTGTQLFACTSMSDMVHKISEVIGPFLKKTFRTGKYFEEYRHLTTERQTPKRTLQLMKYLGCSDVMFADLIAGLLTLDPAKRLTASEAAGHPFFAAHMPLGFFLSKPEQAANRGPVFLTEDIYPYKPEVGGTQIRKPYPTMKLLRLGTSQLPSRDNETTESDLKPSFRGRNNGSPRVNEENFTDKRKTQNLKTLKSKVVEEFQDIKELKEESKKFHENIDCTIKTLQEKDNRKNDDKFNGSMDYEAQRSKKSADVNDRMRELLESIKNEQDLVEEDLDRQTKAGVQNRTSECIVRDHHKLFRPVPRYVAANVTDVKSDFENARHVKGEIYFKQKLQRCQAMQVEERGNNRNSGDKRENLTTGDLFNCKEQKSFVEKKMKTPAKDANGSWTDYTFNISGPVTDNHHNCRSNPARDQNSYFPSFSDVAESRKMNPSHSSSTSKQGSAKKSRPQYNDACIDFNEVGKDLEHGSSRKRRHSDSDNDEYVELLSPFHSVSDRKVRKTGNKQNLKLASPLERMQGSYDQVDGGFVGIPSENNSQKEKTSTSDRLKEHVVRRPQTVQNSRNSFEQTSPRLRKNNDEYNENSGIKSDRSNSQDMVNRNARSKNQCSRNGQPSLSMEEHDLSANISTSSTNRNEPARTTPNQNYFYSQKDYRKTFSEDKSHSRNMPSKRESHSSNSFEADEVLHNCESDDDGMYNNALTGKPVKEKSVPRSSLERQEMLDRQEIGQHHSYDNGHTASRRQSQTQKSPDETYTVLSNANMSADSSQKFVVSSKQFMNMKNSTRTNENKSKVKENYSDTGVLPTPIHTGESSERLTSFYESPEIVYKEHTRHRTASLGQEREAQRETNPMIKTQSYRKLSIQGKTGSTHTKSSSNQHVKEKNKRRSSNDNERLNDQGSRRSMPPGYSRPQKHIANTQAFYKGSVVHSDDDAQPQRSNRREIGRSEFSFRDSPDTELEKQAAQTGIAQRIQQRSIKLKKRARKSLSFEPLFADLLENPMSSEHSSDNGEYNEEGESFDGLESDIHVNNHQRCYSENNGRLIAKSSGNVQQKQFYRNKSRTNLCNPEPVQYNKLTSDAHGHSDQRLATNRDIIFDVDEFDHDDYEQNDLGYEHEPENAHEKFRSSKVPGVCNKRSDTTRRVPLMSDRRLQDKSYKGHEERRQNHQDLLERRAPVLSHQLAKRRRHYQNSKLFAGQKMVRTKNEESHSRAGVAQENGALRSKTTKESWAKMVYKRKSVVNVNNSCLIDFESPGKDYDSD